MKKLTLALLLSITLPALAAEKPADDDPVLFYVNDEAVTESLFRQYYAYKEYQVPADREQQKLQQNRVANELINIFLLSKQAETEKLHQDYQVQQALEVARKNTLSKVLITRYMNKMEITDEDRENAYQAIVEGAQQRAEFKARFITVNDEKTAKTVIDKLSKGEDFSSLSKQYSTENFGKQDDSDLGWFLPDTQEKEIAAAIKALDVGKFNQTPVNTRFGWHVMIVDDKRTPEVPSLAEMKQKLTALIQQQKLREEVAKLRQQATIKTPEKK